MRQAKIERKTKETSICLELNLDQKINGAIKTGVGFLDHMLDLWQAHSGFGLSVKCEGDTWVDAHHTTEDVGIALGEAMKIALGDKKGINRYGQRMLPMDESLILAAVDISGRGYLGFKVEIPAQKVGDFDTELVEEFWQAFVRTSGITLHLQSLAGANTHHIIEGVFKAQARAMKEACAIDEKNKDILPSTKGVL